MFNNSESAKSASAKGASAQKKASGFDTFGVPEHVKHVPFDNKDAPQWKFIHRIIHGFKVEKMVTSYSAKTYSGKAMKEKKVFLKTTLCLLCLESLSSRSGSKDGWKIALGTIGSAHNCMDHLLKNTRTM